MKFPTQTQRLWISWEKRSSGKSVTLIHGFTLTKTLMEVVAQEIKKGFGTGGTVRNGGVIEIQGDQRIRLKPWLNQNGFEVR